MQSHLYEQVNSQNDYFKVSVFFQSSQLNATFIFNVKIIFYDVLISVASKFGNRDVFV